MTDDLITFSYAGPSQQVVHDISMSVMVKVTPNVTDDSKLFKNREKC